MAGNANDALKGGAQGAAVGAPFGPYGAAAGAALGATYGYLNGGESDEEKAQRAAEASKLSQDKQAAIALSNYRQTSRDQSHRLLQNRMAPYQAYSNRLAAGWGAGMSTAGLSAAENPVTLRDTGIGAAQGSNFTGWDESTRDSHGDQRVVHHRGIGDYLNGTGSVDNHAGDPSVTYADGSHLQGSGTTADGFHYQDLTHTNAGQHQGDGTTGWTMTQNQESGLGAYAMQDANDQLQLASRQGRAAPQQGATPANGGYSFFPRRA